jgi:undecaprenyl-diphosphatase
VPSGAHPGCRPRGGILSSSKADGSNEVNREPPSGSSNLAISVDRAIILGTIQGPTELLPVSSSAHLALIPWLAGWEWDQLDPAVRKAFAVAVHAGGAAALVCGQRHSIRAELSEFDGRRAQVLALSFLPPAIAGFGLERQIEARLGGPLATAIGLIVGGVAMAIADLRPQRRGRGDVTALDGLVLGVAQASALAPGVSRNGATLAAARSREFTRDQANFLSRTIALPVISAATALKVKRLRREGVAPGLGRALAAGMAASFVSTLASQKLIHLVERDRALWPYGAYRAALASAVIWKLRRERRARREHQAAAGVAATTNGHPSTLVSKTLPEAPVRAAATSSD